MQFSDSVFICDPFNFWPTKSSKAVKALSGWVSHLEPLYSLRKQFLKTTFGKQFHDEKGGS